MRNLLYTLNILLLFVAQVIGQETDSDHKKTDLFAVTNYIDSLVGTEMEAYKVPGTVVIVVQDSQDVFAKGYGLADVERNVAVDLEKTGFRIASVTKTFTATAVLQLAEEGKIDLHVPISKYLPDSDFSFLKDPAFTAHQLLTHTAGIDLTDIGDAALKPEETVALEPFVRNHIPDVVNPPGQVHSYSNFGYTILGYLIQVISGMPYEKYIQQNILDPLNMERSNMSQPLDEPMFSNLAKSYKYDDGFIRLERDYTNTVPGGGLVSTAKDMTNYLLMHLNGGVKDSIQILSPEYHNLLISQQYGSKNTKYGICYAFFENGWTGRRSLEHTGGQLGFLSLFLLIPETGTGIFISHNNRDDASGFRYDVTREILDTLLHRKERFIELPESSSELGEYAYKYTGRYQQMNYPHSSFEKFGQLFGFFNSAYVVKYEDDGLLTLNGDKFVMLEEDLFHQNDQNSPWNVQFIMNESGTADRIIAGTTSYKKTAWYDSKKVWQRLLLFSLILTLVNILRIPIINLYRRIRKKEKFIPVKNKFTHWLKWTGILYIIGLIGVILNLAIFQGQLADYGVPFTLKIPLFINTLAAISSCLSPIALYILINKNYSKWNYLYVLAIIIISIGFWKFNIIGFQY